MKSFYLSMLFVFLLLSGCSSSSSSGTSNKVGHLIDAPVQGVSYTCDTISGTTDSNGTFEYKDGCTVVFKIGEVTIGEIVAADINTTDTRVYLSEAIGLDRDNISNPQLIQILQLLQTLDEDDNASNGIVVPASAATDLNETLDLTAGTVTTTELETALGETLVTADAALEHYLTTLNEDLNLTFTVPVLSTFTATLAENATAGTAVGSITITDDGDTNITAITLSGTGSADFAVATNGAITVVNAPDFETRASYALTAVATNAMGDSDSVNVTITITNIAEQVPVLAAFTDAVTENSPAGYRRNRLRQSAW